MESLRNLKIPKDYISLVASGLSVLDLTQEDAEIISNNSYVITTNYPLSLHLPGFIPDMHVWGDPKPGRFLSDNLSLVDGACLVTRDQALTSEFDGSELKSKISYHFNNKHERLLGNCTLMWVLDLLKQTHPTCVFLLFGVDGFIPDNAPIIDGRVCAKWYDVYTSHDHEHRNRQGKTIIRNIDRTLTNIDSFVDYFEKVHRNREQNYPADYYHNVFNCSPISRVRYIPRKNHKEILSGKN